MTGRGRGIARGRAGGTAPSGNVRPGEPRHQSAPAVGRGGGRGRARGWDRSQQQQQQQAWGLPPRHQQQQMRPQQVDPPVEGMQALHVAERGPPPEAAAPARRGAGRGSGVPEPATRPVHITDKRGTAGRQISVMSNYIIMKSRPNCNLYQYTVTYSPVIENKKLRCGLLFSLEGIGRTKVFDGMILYLPHKLPARVTTFPVMTKQGSNVELTITLTKELSSNSPICIQVFNIIFRMILQKLELVEIQRKHFYNKRPIPVPAHKLEIWPGFVTSILQYERNVMLGLDVVFKILRTDTVYDYMKGISEGGRRQGFGDFRDAAIKGLVGEIVLTRYNNKTYRIDDIDWDKNPTFKFTLHGGEEISFIDYYKKHYDIEINDWDQPLIVSNLKTREIRARGGDDRPLLLIPELCIRTGLSEETRSDYRVMKDLDQHTKITPEVRRKKCMEFVRDMNSDPKCKEVLEGWNVEFSNDMVEFPARVLPQEKVFQYQSELKYRACDADWGRDMRGKTLIAPITLRDFAVISTRRDGKVAEDFVETLTKVGSAMGITVHRGCKIMALENDRTDTFIRAIKDAVQSSPQMQLVVIILPTNRKDRYDAIKKLCCTQDLAIPSQCVLARTLTKKNVMSVVTKLAMQINCKLGGELWCLEIPIKNVMVVGVDTYHDSARRGQSVMGFISSTNNLFTRYFSQCKFQPPGSELGDKLRNCMSNALQQYRSINGCLPERIIVFRDGVGDGQLSTVVDHEVAQMKISFEDFDFRPKFAVVVVKKRINTRIFHDVQGGPKNPPPGTVVDTEVTKPEWYDYFIVSQSVRQGTVTPTHFNVIYDESGLRPDHMQRLTYKLCHLYYNWPGTVRVPAPCQYAHKLAFLIGQSVHTEHDPSLQDKLFYL